jgi:hypothetical protein
VSEDLAITLSDTMAGIQDALKGVVTFLTGVFTGDWQKAWDGVQEIFKGIWKAILAVVNSVSKDLGDTLSSVMSGIQTALQGLLTFIKGVFTGNWKQAWEGLKTFFKGIWDAIWAILKAGINLIIDGLNSLWSAIYKAVAGIVNTLGSLADAAGDLLKQDWGFSMPSKPPTIPKLARGGIIDQPTLAMVGEAGKEAVVPLENTAFADAIATAILRALTPLLSNNSGAGKSNGDSAQTVVLKIGEYELGRVTVGAINRYHNVIGKVELEV